MNFKAESPLSKIFAREVLDSLPHTVHYESFLPQTSNNTLWYFSHHIKRPDLLKRCFAIFFPSLGPRILAFLCSMVTRYFWWRRWKFSDIFSYGTKENNERYVAVYQPLLFYPATTPWSSFNIKLYSHLFLSVQPLSCAVSTGIAGQPVEFITLRVSILWWIKFQVYLERFLGPT